MKTKATLVYRVSFKVIMLTAGFMASIALSSIVKAQSGDAEYQAFYNAYETIVLSLDADYYPPFFACLDVDEDGLPELLTGPNGSEVKSADFHVYFMREGELSEYDISWGDRFFYLDEGHGIVTCTADGFAIYRMDGENLVLAEAYTSLPQSIEEYVDAKEMYQREELACNLLCEPDKESRVQLLQEQLADYWDSQAEANDFSGSYYETMGDYASNGLAWVENTFGLYGYVDRDGKEIIACSYLAAGDFAENGLAKVRDYNGYGFINKLGVEVIPCQYSEANEFGSGGYVYVCDGAIGSVISEFGIVQYDYVEKVREDFYVARVNGHYVILNAECLPMSDQIYDRIYVDWIKDNDNDLFYAVRDGDFYLLNLQGEEIGGPYDGIEKWYSKNGVVCWKDGFYGAVNKKGETLMPFEYTDVSLGEEAALVYKEGQRWALIDYEGKEILEGNCIYVETNSLAPSFTARPDRFVYVKEENVVEDLVYKTIIDIDGKEIYDTDFERVIDFENYVFVKTKDGFRIGDWDGKYLNDDIYVLGGRCDLNINGEEVFGYLTTEEEALFLDKNANTVSEIPLFGKKPARQNFYYYNIEDGVTIPGLIVQEGDKMGVCGWNGEEIIKTQFASINYIPQENAYLVMSNGKYGVMSAEGDIIIPITYGFMRYDGICRGFLYSRQDLAKEISVNKYGFLDTKGREIIADEYNDIHVYSDSETREPVFFVVEEKGHELIYDKYGNLFMDDKFIDVKIYPEFDFLICVTTLDVDQTIWYDRNGNKIVSADYITDISEDGLAIADSYWNVDVLDAKKQQKKHALGEDYYGAKGFANGLCLIGKGEQYGIIDSNGETVIPFEYDEIYCETELPFRHSVITAVRGEGERKWALLKEDNTKITDYVYDEILLIEDNLAGVKADGRYGVVNQRGEYILKPEYDDIWIMDGIITAWKDETEYEFNYAGKKR